MAYTAWRMAYTGWRILAMAYTRDGVCRMAYILLFLFNACTFAILPEYRITALIMNNINKKLTLL